MEIDLIQLLLTFGIPTAITGIAIWIFQRRIEKSEAKAKEHEANIESLVLMMIQTSKANTVGITAIAKAVQRIPDAHCNGDMTSALAQMEEIRKKEQQFLIDKGIKYLFE
jgi:hypothetical protein